MSRRGCGVGVAAIGSILLAPPTTGTAPRNSGAGARAQGGGMGTTSSLLVELVHLQKSYWDFVKTRGSLTRAKVLARTSVKRTGEVALISEASINCKSFRFTFRYQLHERKCQ